MSFQVIIEGSQTRFACLPAQSVLAAMSAAGARCLQVGCRSGGCGVCRVQVLAGEFDIGTMSSAQVSDEDRAQGIVLACQVFPRSALQIRALGRFAAAIDDPTASLIRGLSLGNAMRAAP